MLSALLALAILGLGSGCTKESKQESQPSVTAANDSQSSSAAAGSPSGQLTQQAAGSAATAAASGAPAAAGTGQDLQTDANGMSKLVVDLKTNRGTVKIRLFPKEAPKTVKRFLELVDQKFYDGLAFHRVVPGFVVQTGDPKSRNKNDPSVGTGGSGKKLDAEFNTHRHVKGSVAMARAQDPNSADSQFYITLNAFPHLDNNYTVFGQVVDFGDKVGGEDVIERIKPNDDLVEIKVEPQSATANRP